MTSVIFSENGKLTTCEIRREDGTFVGRLHDRSMDGLRPSVIRLLGFHGISLDDCTVTLTDGRILT